MFTITAPQRTNVRAAIETLATDADTDWQPALGTEGTRGSEIAETTFTIGAHTKTASRARTVRLIVRRQPTRGQ